MSRHPLSPLNLLAGLAFLTLALAGLAASGGLIDDGVAGVDDGDVIDDTLVLTAIAWALALVVTGVVVMVRRLRREITADANPVPTEGAGMTERL